MADPNEAGEGSGAGGGAPIRRDPPPYGLLLAPIATAGAFLIAPRLVLSEGAAAGVVFVGGATIAVGTLAAALRGLLPRGLALAVLGASLAALLGVGLLGAGSPVAAVLVNTALLAGSHVVGSAIGRRVSEPGHLLPACIVAAAADIASVLHPDGPTHAIANSERALSIVAIQFPVPGTRFPAPVLGAGDLVFLAIVFGVTARHRLSPVRSIAAGALGVLAAGAAAAFLGAAVPALVTIAAATILVVPEARRLRPADRKTTRIACAVAVSVVVAVLLQRFVFGSTPTPS